MRAGETSGAMSKTDPQTADRTKRSGGVRAVTRALAILRAFEAGSPLSLGEIATSAGLDKGTTRRLLLTLMEGRVVTQEAETQRYALGSVIRSLAAAVPEGMDLRGVARPVLVALATELHMTVFLSIYRDGQAICLDRFHDLQGMEVRWWQVGGTLPLNCGGAPKLLLAYQEQAEIDRILGRELTALTPRSIVDPAVLRKRLSSVRKAGFCFAVDDVALGLAALAVPLLDRQRQLVGAISMGGLKPQMSDRGRPIHLERLRQAAEAVRSRL